MKHSKKLLLPLLMLTPLLMANAPVPGVHPKSYDSFTCEYASREEASEGKYRYNFNVTNTGEGYIADIYVQSQGGDIYGYLRPENNLFGNPLIAPGDSETRYVYGVDVDPSTLTFNHSVQAYTQFYDGFKTDKKDVTVIFDGAIYYYYVQVDLKINIVSDTNHDYGFITEVTYKGHKYVTYHYGYSNTEVQLGSSNFELDMEQFSVDKILMVREDAYNNGVDVFFTVLFYIIIIGSILLVSGGIFVAIFFSVKKARRKKLQGS